MSISYGKLITSISQLNENVQVSPEHIFRLKCLRGTWVARLVKRLTLAQVMISVCEFEPHVGLWADSSEPGACLGFCLSLSLCPLPSHALSLSVSQK